MHNSKYTMQNAQCTIQNVQYIMHNTKYTMQNLIQNLRKSRKQAVGLHRNCTCLYLFCSFLQLLFLFVFFFVFFCIFLYVSSVYLGAHSKNTLFTLFIVIKVSSVYLPCFLCFIKGKTAGKTKQYDLGLIIWDFIEYNLFFYKCKLYCENTTTQCYLAISNNKCCLALIQGQVTNYKAFCLRTDWPLSELFSKFRSA